MASRMLVWRGLDAWRAELAEVDLAPDRLSARGVQIGVEPVPYRLEYELATGEAFVTRRLQVQARGAGWRRRIDLTRDAQGSWHCDPQADGDPDIELAPPGGRMDDVQGALDCDLGLSPLTNFMPIRRERLLGGGEPRELVMAWVSVPDLGVHRSEQRYEPVDGRTVRYVGRHRSFVGELTCDADGFVILYPGLGERVPSGR
jgi:hypothetical protein